MFEIDLMYWEANRSKRHAQL